MPFTQTSLIRAKIDIGIAMMIAPPTMKSNDELIFESIDLIFLESSDELIFHFASH